MKKRGVALDRNHFIASVANTMEVLEVFAQWPGSLALSTIAEFTGKPKSSVHRILSTLVNTGFVEQDRETGRYRLTLKIWRLGASALNDLDVVNTSRPHLEGLMLAADETVHLAVLDPSGCTIYVSKVESPRSIRVQTQIGRLNPSWCTATGRALLAFNPGVADQVLAGPLEPRTAGTVTDLKHLRALLEETATKGYAVTKGENHPEMGGIAAPVREHGGNVIAACGLALPLFRMDDALVERCVPLVMRAAEAISSDLGYKPQQQRMLRHGT